jgi:hypothetical protein
MQRHVYGEDVEENKDGRDDGVHEGGRFRARRRDRPDKVEHDHDPGEDAGDRAVDEGRPIALAGGLIVKLHHDPEQVHHRIDTKHQDQCPWILDADQHTDQHDHQR